MLSDGTHCFHFDSHALSLDCTICLGCGGGAVTGGGGGRCDGGGCTKRVLVNEVQSIQYKIYKLRILIMITIHET